MTEQNLKFDDLLARVNADSAEKLVVNEAVQDVMVSDSKKQNQVALKLKELDVKSGLQSAIFGKYVRLVGPKRKIDDFLDRRCIKEYGNPKKTFPNGITTDFLQKGINREKQNALYKKYGASESTKKFPLQNPVDRANLKTLYYKSFKTTPGSPEGKKIAKEIDKLRKKMGLPKSSALNKEELSENYRTLATMGIGTEKKGQVKVGKEMDFYETEHGDKKMGKVVKVTSNGYVVQSGNSRGHYNGRKYTFKYFNPAAMKKVRDDEMKKYHSQKESFAARRDAMRSISRDRDYGRGRGGDNDDVKATDDDRKAADKNPVMQLRRIADLPKGGNMEFKDGKKVKINRDFAAKVLTKLGKIRKPVDRLQMSMKIGRSYDELKGWAA